MLGQARRARHDRAESNSVRSLHTDGHGKGSRNMVAQRNIDRGSRGIWVSGVLLLLVASPSFSAGSWPLPLAAREDEPIRSAAGNAASDKNSDKNSDENSDQEIERLIELLAHPQYAVRVRARYELQNHGLAALDAIRDAGESPNIEIALAARSILSVLEVRWSDDADPAAVRGVLENYGELSDGERKRRIDRLRGCGDAGLPALIRLARFEKNLQLSRYAALAAMEPRSGTPPTGPAAEISGPIRSQFSRLIGDSSRAPLQWLRQWNAELEEGPFVRSTWERFLADERQQLELQGPARNTSPELILNFYRICATRAAAAGNRDDARALALQGIDRLLATRQDLVQAAHWGLDLGLHEVVFQLRQQSPDRFVDEPELIYAVAEAFLKSGDVARAEQSQREALELHPLPPLVLPEQPNMLQEELRHAAMRRREIIQMLRKRGLFSWAILEHQYVIERLPPSFCEAAIHRADQAILLELLQRHRDVVDVLQPLVARMEQDALFRTQCQKEFWLSLDDLSSQLHYHKALAASTADEAQNAFRIALSKGRDNPDILIAMYAHEGGAAWRREVLQQLEAILKLHAHQVRRGEENLKREGDSEETRAALAMACNQYAWLLVNTQGDLQLATQLSQRSLELVPDQPDYLDTLARCYGSAGKLEQAIALQRRALQLEPFSPPFQRQLQDLLQRQPPSSTPPPQ